MEPNKSTMRDELIDIGKLLLAALVTVALVPLISLARPAPADAATNCAEVRLVWMMGSGQEVDDTEAVRFITQVGDAIGDRGYNWRVTQPDWDPVSVEIDPKFPAEYYASMSRGGELLADNLADLDRSCPDEYLILGGYSQGAHSIRSALRNKVPRHIRDRIVTVGLFGDPVKGVAQKSRDGKWRSWFRRDGMPTDLKGKLDNYCHGRDVVCNLTRKSNTADHERYADPGGEIDQFANRFRR